MKTYNIYQHRTQGHQAVKIRHWEEPDHVWLNKRDRQRPAA